MIEEAIIKLEKGLGMSLEEKKQEVCRSNKILANLTIATSALDGKTISEIAKKSKKRKREIYTILIDKYNFDIIDGRPVMPDERYEACKSIISEEVKLLVSE